MLNTMLHFDAGSAGKKNGRGCYSKKTCSVLLFFHQICVLCGSVLDNPRKSVKLKQELVLKPQEIVASENLDPKGYLCNDNLLQIGKQIF